MKYGVVLRKIKDTPSTSRGIDLSTVIMLMSFLEARYGTASSIRMPNLSLWQVFMYLRNITIMSIARYTTRARSAFFFLFLLDY